MQLAQCLLGPAAVVLKQGGEGDMPGLTLPKTARGDTALAALVCRAAFMASARPPGTC
jgi:hypothetical protein